MEVLRMSQDHINREHKDRLFRLVFREKKDLLDLYNAVRGTAYTDYESLEITTIENAVYMTMKNDISFLIDDILNLYEQQSTWNFNMPLRGFLFLADVYRKYIETRKLNLYSSKLVRLPMPQYIVFYNGIRMAEDRVELSLSDAFLVPDETVVAGLECKAIILNINYGHNKELLQQCIKLNHYSQFVAKIREYQTLGMAMEAAVKQAVDDCIRNGILAEILSANRAEVLNLILTEYDEQSHIASEKEISYAEGEEKGIKKGIKKGIEKGINQSEERQSMLFKKMKADGRIEDYHKGMEDRDYLHTLYEEFDLM